jgi:endonuclease YncB( thermonuclease family)
MRTMPWSQRRRGRNPLGAVLTLLAIGLIAVAAALFFPPERTLSGRATALDGDTLRIGETRIRLLGLDAVELEQTCLDTSGAEWPCGRQARAFLAGLTGDRSIFCAGEGTDRYRRVLARCKADADLGDSIVRAGWAVAELEYTVALTEARLNGRGIWSGRFDEPAEWRRANGADTIDIWSWLLGLLGRW